MLPALALAPLTLAAVLVLSALAKLPDPGATHSMMVALRLPRAVAHAAVARLVPWVELTVAALLLTPWRWTFAVGSLAAALLFLTFWVIVARALSLDPRPSCSCFGQVGDHRITGRTLTRNTLLLALALATTTLALQGGTGTGLLTEFTTSDWAWLTLTVLVAGLTVLVLGNNADDEDDEDEEGGAEEGAGAGGGTVPDGVLLDREHDVFTLGELAVHHPQLLVLTNCWCGSTLAAIDRLPTWRARLPQLDVQLVHTVAPWDEPRLTGVSGVWWDPGGQVYTALRAGVSPAAVLLTPDGRVADGPVNGVETIGRFVDDLAAELARADHPDPAEVTGPDVP